MPYETLSWGVTFVESSDVGEENGAFLPTAPSTPSLIQSGTIFYSLINVLMQSQM